MDLLPRLADKKVLLASASPRRKELLQQLGLQFEVLVSNFEENLPHDQFTAAEYSRETATHKAVDVASKARVRSMFT